MHCLMEIVNTHPLTLHFNLYNPPEAAAPVYVPRSLKPLGAFVQAEVRDRDDAVVHKTQPPKFAPKLDASQAMSYVAIDPGYSYGVLLEFDDLPLPPGDYRMEVSYSNLQFRGFPGHDLGDQRCQTSIRFTVKTR